MRVRPSREISSAAGAISQSNLTVTNLLVARSQVDLDPIILENTNARTVLGALIPLANTWGVDVSDLAQCHRRNVCWIAAAAAIGWGFRGFGPGGANVVDLGMVATPITYFAAQHLHTRCSVAVTGSHNPPDYNGLKMVIADHTLSGNDIQDLRRRIDKNDLKSGAGEYRKHDIVPAYFDRIVGDVKLARPMKIAVDCGNGVGGAFAPELYRRMSCDVVPLYCDVDGTFPNHHPDPSQPKNLQDLIRCLQATDNELGFAFDGDGISDQATTSAQDLPTGCQQMCRGQATTNEQRIRLW